MSKLRYFILLSIAASLPAAVTHIEIRERAAYSGGKAFGNAGPYESVLARVDFAVDPNGPANRIVRDVELAPRNERGLVEFSADLHVLKPLDSKNGNGTIFFEVPNRGGHGVPSFSFDHLLLNEGYTLVWLGWQFDVPPDTKLLRLRTPAATDNGKPITGLVRSEHVPDRRTLSFSLADRTMEPYPVADPDDPNSTLTVRDTVEGPRRVIPRENWRFEPGGRVSMAGGFEPGRIYEVVYTAQNPPIAGLGLAAIRDLISFLKYGGAPAHVPFANEHEHLKRAIAFGSSQSGRLLRAFVYDGFNADEKSRKVFDGIIAHVAGAGRGSFNQRFAQPSRDAAPFMNMFYPVDIFPFTDNDQTDRETGKTGGLFARARSAGVVPKIFYTLSSYEYYGRAASLLHTSLDGRSDVPLARDTRIYLFSGCQHGPAAFPPKPVAARNLPDPLDYRWALRALITAMNRWVTEGELPPASRYPRIADGTLVPLEKVRFPKIPGVPFPSRIHKAYRVDYGPRFESAGIIGIEPPVVQSAYPVLVPQVDADGNDLAGIRLPELQHPLATYTGWNLRAPSIGAPDELYSLMGSFIPFASTSAERKGDPRRSIRERYRSREQYLENIRAAAQSLAAGRFLLERDIPLIIERAGGLYDYMLTGAANPAPMPREKAVPPPKSERQPAKKPAAAGYARPGGPQPAGM